MKLNKSLCIMFVTIGIISAMIIVFGNRYLQKKEDSGIVVKIINIHSKTYLNALNQSVSEAEHQLAIVYDGLTMDELVAKLDRFLKNDLAGKGYIYASRSIELGVDPYLAVAISMHETGCNWGCSTLLKQCNNVGGQKSTPHCNGTSYKAYDTLDEGIIGFIDNIYNNYYAHGLTTPEQMNSKYAADTAWAERVNKYIEQIKSV